MEQGLLEGMREWNKAHPQATFDEIEAEMDKRVGMLRKAVLEEVVGEREGRGSGKEREQCPECGEKMVRGGRRKRRLKTRGGEEIEIEREYLSCPRCGVGFFPPGR